MLNFNDEINKNLLALCPEDVELYIVGGYVRDILLKRPCYDRDYVVKGQSAIEFAQKATDLLQGYFVMLDKTHDIARIVMPDKKNTLDFAGCVGADIYSDLANRDYTLNAIACLVENENCETEVNKNGNCELIDPFNGIKDIENKIIRTLSEKNIADDPVRLLRAFRFAAQFDFEIEENTLNFIKKHHKLINNIAFERVNTELIKFFNSENSAKNLSLMKDTGLLLEIFPELAPQKEVPPNLHHHLYLIDHSIEIVRQIEINIKTFPDWAKEHIYREFSTNIRTVSLLKIAALLHDLGKPAAWTIEEDGRHRFIKHEEIGAEMAVDLLKRLKFSKNAAGYIRMLIKNHLYPSQLIREGLDKISEKALMRFFRRITDNTPDLLLLALADRLSAKGSEITEETLEKNIEGTYMLLEKYRESKEEVKTIPKLATGKDAMQLLEISGGPYIGEVLNALKEEQISGNINTREEALEFIKEFSKKKG